MTNHELKRLMSILDLIEAHVEDNITTAENEQDSVVKALSQLAEIARQVEVG